jgi:hypothetical protein
MSDREKVIDRVKKLLALAGEQNPSRAEAESAALRAAAMIEEHKVSQAELGASKKPPHEDLVHVVGLEVDIEKQLSVTAWNDLATLCKPFDVEAVWMDDRVCRFIGYRDDVDAAKALVQFVASLAFTEMTRERRALRSVAARSSFVAGLTSSILERLYAQREAIRSRSLVRVGNREKLDRFMEKFVKTTPVKKQRLDPVALVLGRISGEAAELNRPLGAAK